MTGSVGRGRGWVGEAKGRRTAPLRLAHPPPAPPHTPSPGFQGLRPWRGSKGQRPLVGSAAKPQPCFRSSACPRCVAPGACQRLAGGVHCVAQLPAGPKPRCHLPVLPSISAAPSPISRWSIRAVAATIKVLTTPAAPEQGVLAGVRAILRRDRAGGRGYRHRHPRHHAGHQRDDRAQGRADRAAHHRGVSRRARDGQREPLRPVRPEHRAAAARWCRATCACRCRSGWTTQGSVLLPAGRGGGARAGADAARREQVESVAVGFLHAFVNPAHEQRVRDDPGRSAARCAGVAVLARSRRRCASGSASPPPCANAYVQPLMARYLRRLEDGLQRRGVGAPLFLMLSGGGLTTIETACRFPDPPGGERAGRRRDLLGAYRAAVRPRVRCCRSTWAAPRRRSA